MAVDNQRQPASSTARRERRLRLGLAVGLAALVCLLSPLQAAAIPSVTFGAEFLPWSYLGEGGAFGTELTFSGGEYHGHVAPLTTLQLQLPLGTGLTATGFPICSEDTLLVDGVADCPEGSLAGPLGSFTGLVSFGSEAVNETGTIWPLFGPAGTLYLLLLGNSPVSIEVVAKGHSEAGSGAQGPVLNFTLPLVETVPGAPAMSFTSLSLELGTLWTDAGGIEVNSVTLPSECPAGKFAWTVAAGFDGQPATPVGNAEVDCLQSGSHLRSPTTTSLAVPSFSLSEAQPIVYTATIRTVGTGPVPTGGVTFFEGIEPVTGCSAVPVHAEGTVAVATCTTSYAEPGGHTVSVAYSGDQNDRWSRSAPTTVTVQEGEAPPAGGQPSNLGSDHSSGLPVITHTGGGPVPAIGTATLSTATLTALLKKQLVRQKAATVGRLLKRGGLSLPVTLPEAGTLGVSWYAVPKGASLAKKPKPLLVASGSLSVAANVAAQLKLKLSTAGRRKLRRIKRMKLVAEATFVPSGGGNVVRAQATVAR
jgi:Bacterial Ig-like domain (group 3)